MVAQPRFQILLTYHFSVSCFYFNNVHLCILMKTINSYQFNSIQKLDLKGLKHISTNFNLSSDAGNPPNVSMAMILIYVKNLLKLTI